MPHGYFMGDGMQRFKFITKISEIKIIPQKIGFPPDFPRVPACSW